LHYPATYARDSSSPENRLTNGSQPPDNPPRNGRDWELTDEIRDAIHAAIGALPPMTDEQIDAIAEVIITARERRRRTRQAPAAKPGHD